MFSASVASSNRELTTAPQVCENVRYAQDKCLFVRENCQADSFGMLNYIKLYYCTSSRLLGVIFLGLMGLWLVLLFATIGTAASDFLCINLTTISDMLGLTPSMAGVTFVAYGNGSPDVVSTYTAMKIGSGSLAVGELIGAASFITAVVAGVMVFNKPILFFNRLDFLLNVIFFTVAVSFVLYFLSDGVLKAWECLAMIAIYVAYVFCHWYLASPDESESVNYANIQVSAPETLVQNLSFPSKSDLSSHKEGSSDDFEAGTPKKSRGTLQSPPKLRLIVDHCRHRGGCSCDESTDSEDSENGHTIVAPEESYFLSPNINTAMIASFPQRPSYGALQEEITRRASYHGQGSTSNIYPASPISAGPYDEETYDRLVRLYQFKKRNPHYESQPHVDMLHSSGGQSPVAPIRPSLLGALQTRDVLRELKSQSSSRDSSRANSSLNLNSPAPVSHGTDDASKPIPNEPFPFLDLGSSSLRVPSQSNERVPVENIGSDNNTSRDTGTDSVPVIDDSLRGNNNQPSAIYYLRRFGCKAELWDTWSDIKMTLFPDLCDLGAMSWSVRIVSIVTTPISFLLKITIPVYEDPPQENSPSSSPTGIFGPEGLNSISITRWLLLIQAITGPLFVTWVGFSSLGLALGIFYSLIVSCAIWALIFWLPIGPLRSPPYMKVISFVGFAISIMWVSLIANEVVAVLKTMGLILHISDAILGLTVFAVGNSLGDFILNTTIANNEPMTAFTACFASPMLNILVGIGFSGLLVMHNDNHHSSGEYIIDISHTLIISGATLLLTLLFLLISVPLNNWEFSRSLGIVTVFFWITATTINVMLEIILK